jgi:CubicO group peptidase (beta-lactamase class C family)
MADHVARDAVGGAAWLVSVDDHVDVGVAGVLTRGEPEPIRRDSIFRISSMTKPMVAVGAMILIEECRLRLDDPVDGLLPELADRRVLVDPRGAVDGKTVPAVRPITVRDVLTFRLGLGMDFAAPWPQPLLEEMARLGLGSGPPEPQVPPGPDEWMNKVATLPLLYQPGERWLYHTGADVLGVLMARAAAQPLDVFLSERVFEPLGMVDTGFTPSHVERLGTCYAIDPASGTTVVYDAPDGQWAKPPAFPSGGAGLVSTLDDVHSFARMLLARGRLGRGDDH